MSKKRVLVVLGGTSGERKVSFDSGRACLKALKIRLHSYFLIQKNHLI